MSTERKHTPGPWVVGPHPGNGAGTEWRQILSEGGPFPGAYVGEALKEDANLMAAAPGLLDDINEIAALTTGFDTEEIIAGIQAVCARALARTKGA